MGVPLPNLIDCLYLLQVVYLFNNPANSGAVQLNQQNLDTTLGMHFFKLPQTDF